MITLEADGLRKDVTFDDGRPSRSILFGASLSVEAGEMVAIVGPSGAGKSTLMNCLAGLDVGTAGTVRALGTDLSSLSPNALSRFRAENVSVIFQDYNLLPPLTTVENVELPLRLRRLSRSRAMATEALAAVGLADKARQYPVKLSGGEQQRVAIARALAAQTSFVFADEPTGALDIGTGADVLALLRQQAERGASVIIVTHDLESASKADRVAVMVDGMIRTVLDRPSVETLLGHVQQATTASVA